MVDRNRKHSQQSKTRELQVHTSTDRQDFNYGQFTVIRRFKDFVWLSHRLEEEFPGIVMPALPVKMLVGKFDQTFVEVKHAERLRCAFRAYVWREQSAAASSSTSRAGELLEHRRRRGNRAGA